MATGRPRVVVGLTGGIAAYKVVAVIRGLVKRGADVTVVPSESALNFIGKSTLEAISRNIVTESLFDDVARVRHVALGQNADAILIAPATANTLSALADGRADSLLLTTVLASNAPVIVAPAMHSEMWENAATRSNVDTLRARGFDIVGPVTGELTGGDSGIGRLANENDIIDAVWSAAQSNDLSGQTFLITAGGTREPIDPVRYIGNRSTGHMGVACARVARDRGARVILVAAHLEVDPPAGVEVVAVSTAREMHEAVLSRIADVDAFLSVAAVSDFRIANVSDQKVKKTDGPPTIVLEENPDIVRDVVALGGKAFVVSFAAETDDERFVDLVTAKARAKGSDLLVANLVGDNRGFGSAPTRTLFIELDGSIVDTVDGSKFEVATRIVEHVSRQKANQS
jgi:phosphopantothenoylcysteine decarboxylase/phosphopantothenate--cysteine ligase